MDYELTTKEQARADHLTDLLLSRAAREGLAPTPDELKSLPGFKLAVLTDLPLDSDGIMGDIKALPRLAAEIQTRTASTALERGDPAAHAELANMTPGARMEYGRKIEAAKRAAEKVQPVKQMDATEEAQALLWIRALPPSARIAAARAAGMI